MEHKKANDDRESLLNVADTKRDLPQNVEKDTTTSHFDDMKKELGEFGLAQPEQSEDTPFKKPAFCDLVEEKKQDDSGEIDFGNEFKLKLSIAKRLETTRPR